MDPEGMVHALEKTHGLLKPGGLLIDIHPTGRPPLIEVHLDDTVRLAGHLDETDNFVEYFQADDALAAVTQRGLFQLERQGLFTFMLHAPTVKALTAYIEAEWSDALLPDQTVQRATALLGRPGPGKTVILREHVHIARFRAAGK